MRPISLTATVDAPRERVFDFICDLSVRPAWTDHFASDFRLLRLEPRGEGAAARFWVDAPGGINFMETVVAEAERPHLVVENGRGGRLDRIRVRTNWELSEGAGGVTDVRLTFWTEPGNPIDRIAEMGLAKRWWKRNWKRALRRLSELVEAGQEPEGRVRVAGGDRLPAGLAG